MNSRDDQPQDEPKLDDLAGIPGLDFQPSASEPAIENLEQIAGLDGQLDPPLAPGIDGLSSSIPNEAAEPQSESNPEPNPEFAAEPISDPITESAPGLGAEANAESINEAGTDTPSEPLAADGEAPQSQAEAQTDAASAPNPAMEKVKAYSENIQIATAPVEAAYPFSLRIDGKLNAWEREKLIDLLASENMGIREVDLEPQFDAGRILLPRISEYAGVLLVQMLRGTSAEITLGPSDQIFSTEDTREDLSLPQPQGSTRVTYESPSVQTDEAGHPAERIPVLLESEVPGHPSYAVIDLISASAALSVETVEATRSTRYQETLEALKRELRYKAHRKGANAVVNLTVQLDPLRMASQYRLTVMGSAIFFR